MLRCTKTEEAQVYKVACGVGKNKCYYPFPNTCILHGKNELIEIHVLRVGPNFEWEALPTCTLLAIVSNPTTGLTAGNKGFDGYDYGINSIGTELFWYKIV